MSPRPTAPSARAVISTLTNESSATAQVGPVGGGGRAREGGPLHQRSLPLPVLRHVRHSVEGNRDRRTATLATSMLPGAGGRLQRCRVSARRRFPVRPGVVRGLHVQARALRGPPHAGRPAGPGAGALPLPGARRTWASWACPTTPSSPGPGPPSARWRARCAASGGCSTTWTWSGCSGRTRWRWRSWSRRLCAGGAWCSACARTSRATCAPAIRAAAASCSPRFCSRAYGARWAGSTRSWRSGPILPVAIAGARFCR